MNELNVKKPGHPDDNLCSIKNENEFGLGVTSNNNMGSQGGSPIALFSTERPELCTGGGGIEPPPPTSCSGGGAAAMKIEEDIIL